MRVAMIGSGVGANLHAPAIQAYEGAEIVGVAGLDELLLADFGEAHGVSARFTDFREMIEKTRPDKGKTGTATSTSSPDQKVWMDLSAGSKIRAGKWLVRWRNGNLYQSATLDGL